MKKRQLGNSGIFISEISFGCMSLDVSTPISEQILQQAFEAGINFFDTADLYDKGENEKLVGRALHSVRDQVIIATKVGNQWRNDGSGWDWNPTKKYILTAVEDSLSRLNTDYIDLYQLHGGTIKDQIDETIEAFEQLKKEGKIREYGISSIRPNVIREWSKRSNLASVMMQYSLLDRRPEEHILDKLYNKSISVITRGTLAKGLLLNKPAGDYLGCAKEEVELMKSALSKTNNPVAASIQFVLNHPTISSAVLGVRTFEQLHEIIKSCSVSISAEQIDQLKKILIPKVYLNHR